jgi:1,2-diacylglycerol 3-beta-glucosyltransferase
VTILVMAVLVTAATAAIIVSFTYAFGMYLEGRLSPGNQVPEASDLFFVFVIPCLNEERVIGVTLERLGAVASDNSVILVVDDGSDDRTAAVVRSRTDERTLLLQRQLPEARQGKGAALNAALKYLVGHPVLQGHSSHNVIVCLLDADGRLDPEAPDVAGNGFVDPRVGGVQIAVRIGNRDDGLLPRLQDMEFVCYTEIFQRCRSRLGFAGLGGNGQFTRLSALLSLGSVPWSPSTLTEDLDLGIRLVLSGWRTTYSSDTQVHQQGVRSIRDLIRQRSRWFQGLLQCWRLIPHVARSTAGRVRLDLLHMLLTPILIFAAFLMTLSFVIGPLERIVHPDFALGPFGLNQLVAWYLLTFFPALLFAAAYRRISGVTRIRSLALAHAFVLYGLLWVAAGIRAVSRLLAGRGTWIKTDRLAELAESKLSGSWSRMREVEERSGRS